MKLRTHWSLTGAMLALCGLALSCGPKSTLVAPAQAAQNLLDGGDASKLKPFSVKFEGGKGKEEGEKHWQWAANTWDPKTVGEFALVDNMEGSKAMALRNLSGPASLQVYNWQKLKLNPLRRYQVSLDYLTTGDAHGQLELNSSSNDKVQLPLKPTSGKWTNLTHHIDVAKPRDLGILIQHYGSGAANSLYIKTIAVSDVGAAQLDEKQKSEAAASLGLKARTKQNIPANSLYGKLKSEYSKIGEAHFVAGTTADETTLAFSNGTTIDVAGQPFTKARRIVITEAPKQIWEVNASVRNKEPIHKGDALLLTFYGRGKPGKRAVDTGEGALVQPIIKSSGDFGSDYHNRRELTTEWERYWVKTEKTADRDYAPGDIEVLFMLGHQAQEVEIGGVALMAFPAGSNLQAMPKPSYDYVGRDANAAWRKEADRRIEQYRKGNLRVLVRDANGRPVPNAQVKVEMKKHAFLFGTAVALDKWRGGGKVSDKDRDRYREIVLKHFNMIETENSLKWRAMAEWGMPLEQTIEQLRWAKENGLYTRGHVLVWPSWEHTPNAVKDKVKNNPEELRKVVRNHVTDLVTRTKGLVDDWDVTNETAGNRDYMDILGPDEMIQWYRLARAADPKVKLTFNEPNFGNEGMEGGSFPSKKLPQYKGWVDYLVKNKAPLDRLGSQEHGGTMAKIGRKKDPTEAWKLWDRIYKDYGKELIFTELDVNIENDQDEEQLGYQADVLRDTITLAFAHPAFAGLNQWGFWENSHWFPKAALWRKDWSIKPNGEAYLDLVYNKWWTKASGKANAQGEYSTRGFKGDYEIEVTAGGKTIKVPGKIGDKANVVTVKLP